MKKRIQKKQRRRREAEVDAAIGVSASIRTLRTVTVTVPCTACDHPTLQRTYLPLAGSMNGRVCCPRCAHEASYMEALTTAMDSLDPIPAPLRPPPVVALQPIDAPAGDLVTRLRRVWPLVEHALFTLFGLRRKWRFQGPLTVDQPQFGEVRGGEFVRRR